MCIVDAFALRTSGKFHVNPGLFKTGKDLLLCFCTSIAQPTFQHLYRRRTDENEAGVQRWLSGVNAANAVGIYVQNANPATFQNLEIIIGRN